MFLLMIFLMPLAALGLTDFDGDAEGEGPEPEDDEENPDASSDPSEPTEDEITDRLIVTEGDEAAETNFGDNGDDFISTVEHQGSPQNGDLVWGGVGDDTIWGDSADTLRGGGGTDMFGLEVDTNDVSVPVSVLDFENSENVEDQETIVLIDENGDPLDEMTLLENLTVSLSENDTIASLFFDGAQIGELRSESEFSHDVSDWIGNLSEGATVDVHAATSTDLQTFEGSGNLVANELFGGNGIYSVNTDNGVPNDFFQDAVDGLDAEYIRFPAGQGDSSDGVEGVDWLNIVSLETSETEGPSLREELVNMLEWARDQGLVNDSGEPVGVTLVIPTKHISLEEYETFADEIEDFAELVMAEYSDVVVAFEIGNEYWAMGETEYGQKANLAIQALNNGIMAAGELEGEAPSIIVQMATPYAGSDFHASVDDRPWLERLQDANQQIIDQLDPLARDAIDGVVEHYYWNMDNDAFNDNGEELRYINRDYEVWDQNFEQELDLVITEWNVKASSEEQNGMKALGVLSEQVENMVEMGVDAAHVWPFVHNTINTIAGPRGEAPEFDEEGRSLNNLRGAVYDLMSSSLPGMELMESEFSNDDGSIEINSYESDEKVVFFLASRSADVEVLEIDFSDAVDNYTSVTGTKIGYDRLTSDGMTKVRGGPEDEAQIVEVNGLEYALNENDVQPKYTDYVFASTDFNVALQPFEFMAVTFMK